MKRRKKPSLKQATHSSACLLQLVWFGVGEEVGRKKRGMKGRGTGQPGADK